MPLIYQHNINATTKIGLWQISEPASFFLERVPLKKEVTHPHKRLQHLAGRYLLPVLFDDFPLQEILIADTRKPFLETEQYHFSISHCNNYAAAMVSSNVRVGIDVEVVTSRVTRIRKKFLDPTEEVWAKKSALLEKMPEEKWLTLLWSAKEAVFKWYGLGGLDFSEHMQLSGVITQKADQLMLPFQFKKEGVIELTVHARMMNDMVLAWTS